MKTTMIKKSDQLEDLGNGLEGYLEKPSWLELPEEEKLNHLYWCCVGEDMPLPWYKGLFKKKSAFDKEKNVFLTLHHSKEEAEIFASRPRSYWNVIVKKQPQ